MCLKSSSGVRTTQVRTSIGHNLFLTFWVVKRLDYIMLTRKWPNTRWCNNPRFYIHYQRQLLISMWSILQGQLYDGQSAKMYPGSPFTNISFGPGMKNYRIPSKLYVKLFIASQTSMTTPLRFGNRLVISSYWRYYFDIHGFKLIHVCKGPFHGLVKIDRYRARWNHPKFRY